MKALTLTQPWAQLVVMGEKQIETRGFRPVSLAPREIICIHAASQMSSQALGLVNHHPVFQRAMDRCGVRHLDDLTLGAIVGAVQVVDWKTTDQLRLTQEAYVPRLMAYLHDL